MNSCQEQEVNSWNAKDFPRYLEMLTPEAAAIVSSGDIFMRYSDLTDLPAIFSQYGLELAGDICDDCGAFVKPTITPYGGGIISRGECQCVKAKREAEEAERHRREQIEYRQNKAMNCGIPPKLQNASFENFRINKGNTEMVDRAKRYIKIWPEPTKIGMGLTFTGSTGIGKSHIASVIAKEIIMKGGDAVFISVEQFLDDIKETFDDTSYGYNSSREKRKTKSDIMDRVCNCGLLVFDDLMANSTTEWALNMIEQVYDRRTAQNRPIITTTNFSEAELRARLSDCIQERLYSRLIGNSIVVNLGEQRDERMFIKGMEFDAMMESPIENPE
jgi:DNA replication protein DnaC